MFGRIDPGQSRTWTAYVKVPADALDRIDLLRFDFTEAKLHSLSDSSIQVVKALRADVHLKAFFREGNMDRGRMEDLLKIYAFHSPRVKVAFIVVTACIWLTTWLRSFDCCAGALTADAMSVGASKSRENL